MFNLKNGSSGLKKAAYLAGIRDGFFKPHGNETIVYDANRSKNVTLNPADIEHAAEMTWKEVKSGK